MPPLQWYWRRRPAETFPSGGDHQRAAFKNWEEIFKAASAYQAASKRRVPPPACPLPGEP
jgi:hypothetical protein